VPFAGELLAMVVIAASQHAWTGARHAVLHPVSRIVFDLDPELLLWFGLTFVAFVMFSPDGWSGYGRRLPGA